jgi:hypothetical protein
MEMVIGTKKKEVKMSKKKYFLGTLVGILSLAMIGIFPSVVEAGNYYRAYNSNGGFESTNPGQGWGQYQGDYDTECINNCLLSAAGAAHSGTWQAILGGSNNARDAILYPTEAAAHVGITLPAGTNQAILTYYYKLTSSDGTQNDVARVVVSDATTWLPLATNYYLSSINNTSTWAMGSIDVTPFIGQQIYFFFGLDNDSTSPTSFYVDDVTLTARITDNSKPGGAMNINKNAKWTKYAKTTLYFNGTDSGSGVKYMRISNNKKKWTKWIKYSKTYKKWDMSNKKYGGNSIRRNKKVYVQFKDGAGNVSKVKADTIRWRW